MPMKIAEVVDEVPTKKVVREKGSYHEDVLALIEQVNAEEPGKWVTAEFTNDDGELDPKQASVRASTLRSAGFRAYTRGATVYVAQPEDEEE